MKISPAAITTRQGMHHLLAAIIVPRPIAWVSTVDSEGVFNLAPFSFFTAASVHPPIVCFSVGRKRNGQKKDTLRNIEQTRDFVVNVVDETLAEAMNQTSADYPPEVDEFKETHLTSAESELVKSPFLAESPFSMECRLRQIVEFGEASDSHYLVLGEVVCFHVRDELYVDGQIDVSKLNQIGRLGGDQFYCRTGDRFRMERP
jgi:flavin reductase (DIM6/NTAB) family NADH-FMN oxidoreductase RutF